MGDRTPRIVIVGAGLAGISAAVALKNQLYYDNFTIYEQAAEIGGTWRDNTYPGCGSDVPGHWYSLSTELNPNWSSYWVPQPEIRDYWRNIWVKHKLQGHTICNTSVHSTVWDNDAQLYHITLKDSVSGEEVQTEAEIMIWAIGGFVSARFPSFSGRDSFKGDMWHSAQWNHDVDLSGKRVGVVGNGCSAAQFIPQIVANKSTRVVQFCRTPQWYMPRENYTYPTWIKKAFTYIPGLNRAYRNILMAKADLNSLLFRKDNRRLTAIARSQLTKYLKHLAPKDQLKRMVPSYPPGCKRIILDPGYLKCLREPNVQLEWTNIDKVTPEGIQLVSGEVISLDVLIFGTGYIVESDIHAIRGSDGQTVQEYFNSQGGPTAYLGTCVPGFPNAFLLLGPNTATGHASVVFSEEVQIQYVLQFIEPLIRGKFKSFKVRAEATDEYNLWLQDRLKGSVWTECSSYYHSGRGSTGKLIATFPGSATLFWWLCRKPKWEHFKVVGGDAWVAEQRARRNVIVPVALGVLVASVAVGIWTTVK